MSKSASERRVDKMPAFGKRSWNSLWLEFLFAFLTAAGGVVLGSGQMATEGTETIAAIAVFTAIIGFLFVDWLRIFELPPLGAYLAMGGAAAYCVHEFWSQSDTGRPQMLSVALLLVLVQGTLMLQRKTRRILEQLAVFCLLELVVAAIFNDAFSFGLMLLPLAVLAGIALSLLTTVTAIEDIESSIDERPLSGPRSRMRRFIDFLASRTYESRTQRSYVRTASPDSIEQANSAAGAWTKYAMVTLLPAVLLIAGAFFYVLPRRVKASRAVGSGNAMVGFDDRMRLDQLGRLSEDSSIALKVEMVNRRTGAPFRAPGSVYLRGKTLEIYEVQSLETRPTATWVSRKREARKSKRLPGRYYNQESENRAGFDSISVKITCETMNRPSLFSIAPYHQEESAEIDEALMHVIDCWTLQRRDRDPPYPRIQYSFGTTAFSNGMQTPLIAEPVGKQLSISSSVMRFSPFYQEEKPSSEAYRKLLLEFDPVMVPTIVRKASEIFEAIPESTRSQGLVARTFEQYLSKSSEFDYTLNIDAKPIPNVDPTEQFMATDRVGHCQYFASALALMLRSVGIPCRVVVGYRTEEFNSIGDYHIARQSHAHAWVEALIDADQLPSQMIPSDQRPAKTYWLRLDPTPAASAEDDGNAEGVGGLMNLANNLWDDYVVDMDQRRQTEGLGRAAQLEVVQESYEGFFTRLKNRMKASFIDESTAGSVRLNREAMILLFVSFCAVLGIWLGSRWLRAGYKNAVGKTESDVVAAPAPQLDFYRAMLEQLQRLGIARQRHETPYELLLRLDADLPAVDSLTRTFVQQRYGERGASISPVRLESELSRLIAAVDRRLIDPPSPG